MSPRKKQAASDDEANAPRPLVPYAGTILDAMDLAGMAGHLWAKWRVFWKACFALPMGQPELEIYQRHTGRASPPTAPISEAWLLVGRRGGKSRNLGLAAGWLAIRRNYESWLAPGEQAVIAVIAADRKQARQVMNYLKGFCRVPEIAPYVRRTLASSVEFTTAVTVEVATASYRTTRGYTYVALLADEVAFWRSDDSAEPDTEILTAIRPGMATIPESLILAGSTPYAKRGELFRAWKEHYGKGDSPTLVWNADTLSMHDAPRVAAFVADQFEKDFVIAASEYGTGGTVVFRHDVESFVEQVAIEAVTVNGRRELLPEYVAEGRLKWRYFAFTDPSGGSQDSWTLAIAHLDGDKVVLDLVREIQPQFSPSAVVSEYVLPLKLYGIRELEGDHYGGEFPRELFRAHGITYRPADQPKSDLYREWLPLLNAGHMELLDLPRLKAQFCGLERKVARSGQESIDHVPGGHDDVANAVAGSMVRAARMPHAKSVRFAI